MVPDFVTTCLVDRLFPFQRVRGWWAVRGIGLKAYIPLAARFLRNHRCVPKLDGNEFCALVVPFIEIPVLGHVQGCGPVKMRPSPGLCIGNLDQCGSEQSVWVSAAKRP